MVIEGPFVERWANMCESIVHTLGAAEVTKRCKDLPKDFRKKVIDELENRANERELGY